MFPLGSVLFPSMVLPLHIFEDRYRSLVADCLESKSDFGVVLIERGAEVGGGDSRSDFGCTAQIVEATEFDDGRWFIGAVGTKRLRVLDWLDDDPYPLARVEEVDEAPSSPNDADSYAAVVDELRSITALLATQELPVEPVPDDLAADPALGTFQVAALSPLGAFDRQKVLRASSPAERIELLQTMLRDHGDDLRRLL